MVSQDSLLVTFVKLVDCVPMPALPVKRGRGASACVFGSTVLKGVRDHDCASPPQGA